MAEESKGTVLLALGANVAIAAAKFTGGLLTGSAAMLSEGAHSVADTVNEGFLFTALVRSGRPADARHPFGYGKERFFWSLLAAVGILVLGAGFSLLEAYRSFTSPESAHGSYYLISYIVLGIAFLAEGSSFLKAVRQIRAEAAAAGRHVLHHLRASSDPSVKTVATEDSAALAGLLLAFAGIGLHQLTGDGRWEGGASLLIGLLLLAVATALGNDVKGLLIGESADPVLRGQIADYLGGRDDIDRVVDLLTMHMGANDILLAAKLDLAAGLTSDDVEAVSAEIDAGIRDRWPQVRHVFLDPTGERESVQPIGLPAS